eukprot:m.135269 g.135269  ORF g.135269 m.135269 type:complete len:209 (-) comp9525_c0_seq3:246-872(-)
MLREPGPSRALLLLPLSRLRHVLPRYERDFVISAFNAVGNSSRVTVAHHCLLVPISEPNNPISTDDFNLRATCQKPINSWTMCPYRFDPSKELVDLPEPQGRNSEDVARILAFVIDCPKYSLDDRFSAALLQHLVCEHVPADAAREAIVDIGRGLLASLIMRGAAIYHEIYSHDLPRPGMLDIVDDAAKYLMANAESIGGFTAPPVFR